MWVFSSKSRIDEKNPLNIFYKLYSFQNNTIQWVDNREYLGIKFNNKYTSFVNKHDGIIYIIMNNDENKTEYKLQSEEEKLNEIQDVLYNKEDDCILTICSSNWRYNFYLVFGDWSIFSELDIDIMKFYDFMKFKNWELEFVVTPDALKKYQPTFFWKLFGKSKNIPEYLSIEDDGLVHKIDLHKLHTYLQSNELK